METLRSPSNPLLKQVRRAVQRGGLTDDGHCLAETFRLLEEAIRSGCEIGAVFGAESARHRLGSLPGGLAGVRLAILPPGLISLLLVLGVPLPTYKKPAPTRGGAKPAVPPYLVLGRVQHPLWAQ